MSFCLGRLHAFVSIFLILFDSFSGLDNKSSLFAYFVLIRGTILMQEIHKFAAAAWAHSRSTGNLKENHKFYSAICKRKFPLQMSEWLTASAG